MICDVGDVAVAAFPYVDIGVFKPRPILILSARDRNARLGESLAAMITTAARSQWADDTPISDWKALGLTGPCVLRTRLVSIGNDLISRRLGPLGAGDRQAFARAVGRVVAL